MEKRFGYQFLIFLFLLVSFICSKPLPSSLSVTVLVDGKSKTLHLHKRTVRTPDYSVKTWDKSNGYTEISPIPEARTFTGTVAENPNAMVYAAINQDNIIIARCIDQEWGHGYRWAITQNISSQLGTPKQANAMPVQKQGWPKSGSSGTPNIGLKIPIGVSSGGVDHSKLVEADIAMDITYKTYSDLNGKIENILAKFELEALLYDMIMTRDALIRVPLAQTVIRTEKFYNDPSTPGLGEMNKEWKKEPLKSTRWDMVWASNGWYAWGNNIGKNENSMSAGAMHHENGHNWGAFHLAYMCDIMGGNKPNHGPMTVEVVRKKRTEKINEGDLSQASTFEDPIHPHTHVDIIRTDKDKTVDIDVLANDWDSNGDVISVSSFTASTESGGSVIKNPDGTLRYTPAKGFVGKDIIVYTVEDNSAKKLRSRDIVHIEVVNNDLLLHYAYEEESGTKVVDSSVSKLHGDLNGADFATHSVQSPLGKGIKSFGRQNENQIESGIWSGVVVGTGEVMPVTLVNDRHASPFELEYNRHSGYCDPMNGDYSFATWFKFDSYESAGWNSGGHYIASKWWHMETRVGWDLQAIDGKLTLHWRVFDGSTKIQTLSSKYNLVEGRWYHAAAIFDQTKNEARIYLNGKLLATKSNAFESHGFIFNGRAPLCLGSFADESGYLDDTRIYSKALSTKEVFDLYAMAELGKPSFFVDSFSDTITNGATYVKGLAEYLWDGGDTNLIFASQDIPSWLTLTTKGILIGNPTAAHKGVYTFTVRAVDSDGDSDDLTVTITVHTNALLVEYWKGISGSSVSDLTSHASYPKNPSSKTMISDFDIENNYDNTYGARVSGYLVPTKTGDYQFWLAANDAGELWLSTDSSKINKRKIAYTSSWTSYKEWEKYATQKSSSISLIAGKKYYIEALIKDDAGNDHLSVAWKGPGMESEEIIPNDNFEPLTVLAKDDTASYHLALDEISGTTINDSIGNLTGTTFGNPDLTIKGATAQTGTAIAFDGVNDSVALNINQIIDPWTLTMWVKNQKTNGTSTLFEYGKFALRLRQYGSGKVGLTKFGTSDYSFDYFLPIDKWIHLIFTCDGKATHLWADGVKVGSIPAVSLPLGTMGGKTTKAQIDDIKIYKFAFSNEHIINMLNEQNVFTSKIVVPNVISIDETVALKNLSANYLNVNSITKENSKTVPKGLIISQYPEANTIVDKNSDVDLVVSLGAGTSIIHGGDSSELSVADLHVYPNPVSRATENILFKIPSKLSGYWTIVIYDALGNVVDDASFNASERTTYTWDLKNKSGINVAIGSYLLIAQHVDREGITNQYRKVIGIGQ